MLEFLGGTYDKQLSIARIEAPRNNLLMRLAGADLGWSRGQRVSSTLRPREACWIMQRRHGVPGSLKPTETSWNVPSSSQPGQCRERSEVHPQKKYIYIYMQEAGLEAVADRHDDAAALCLYDRWRGLPGETTGERLPRGR